MARMQFQSLFDVYGAEVTHNFASLADGAGETLSISVPGAAIGDTVMVSAGVDISDMTLTAYVQAADTVEVRLQNESAGVLDLASTTIRVCVLSPDWTNLVALT